MLGGITMNTLKHMLKQGRTGRELAWEYFRHMQKIDAANVRHYTKMLQTCRKESEIDGLMAELDQSGIRPNAGNAPDLQQLILAFGCTESAELDGMRVAPLRSDIYYTPQGVRSPRPVF